MPRIGAVRPRQPADVRVTGLGKQYPTRSRISVCCREMLTKREVTAAILTSV